MEKYCSSFVLLRRHSTLGILSRGSEHQNNQYKDLLEFPTPYSLKKILRELLNSGLIKCFSDAVTGDNKVELTEKGKNLLEVLHKITEILKEDSPDAAQIFPSW